MKRLMLKSLLVILSLAGLALSRPVARESGQVSLQRRSGPYEHYRNWVEAMEGTDSEGSSPSRTSSFGFNSPIVEEQQSQPGSQRSSGTSTPGEASSSPYRLTSEEESALRRQAFADHVREQLQRLEVEELESASEDEDKAEVPDSSRSADAEDEASTSHQVFASSSSKGNRMGKKNMVDDQAIWYKNRYQSDSDD